jgi:hypothetical protein
MDTVVIMKKRRVSADNKKIKNSYYYKKEEGRPYPFEQVSVKMQLNRVDSLSRLFPTFLSF